MESLERYASGLNKLMYAVLGPSVFFVGLGLVGLLQGKTSWMLIPLFIGLPIASTLVIMGRREVYMAKSVVGFCLALASLGAASLFASFD